MNKDELSKKNKPNKDSIKVIRKNRIATLRKYFNKQTFLLLVVLDLAVGALLYSLVYLKYKEKADEINESNEARKVALEELIQYYNNIDDYNMEMNSFKAGIDDIINSYPADAREEDFIMIAVNLQEKNEVDISTVNIGETQTVYEIPYETVQKAQIEDMNQLIRFQSKQGTYVNVTSYDQLKGIMKVIANSPNRIAIEKINYVKNDSEEEIDGSIILKLYSAMGTGKEYVVPDITPYKSGTTDVFNTRKVSTVDDESESNE